MQNTILLFMSLAGSITFILYILFYFIAKTYFPIRWRYGILKMTLFFFLFPLPYFKYRIEGFLIAVFPFFKDYLSNPTLKYTLKNVVIISEKGWYVSSNIKMRWILLTLAGIVTTILIVTQLYQYLKLNKKLISCNGNIKIDVSDSLLNSLERIKKTLGIKQKVSVVLSSYIKVPSIIGIFRPKICLPQYYPNQLNVVELELVLFHELIHIKHKDLLYKFVALLVIAIHWFNPLCYLIFYEICNMNEIYCDEQLVKSKDEEFIKKYGSLLINAAERKKSTIKEQFMSGLVNSNIKALKRRIIEMKRKNKKNLRMVSVIVGILIALVAATTVFAYEETPQIKMEDQSVLEEGKAVTSQWGEFVSEDKKTEKKSSVNYFTDTDGNIYEVGKEAKEEKISCLHKYVTGTYFHHIASGDACNMNVYNAKRCSICGYLAVGSQINTITYAVCPH